MISIKPKILYVSPVLRYPSLGGPNLRVNNSIKVLSTIGHLHLLSIKPLQVIGGVKATDYYTKQVDHFAFASSVSPRLVDKLRERFDGRSQEDKIVTEILAYVKKNDIDIVWFGYGYLASAIIFKLKPRRKDLKIVCDTDSVWSEYVRRKLPFVMGTQAKKKIEDKTTKALEIEKKLLLTTDVLTAVSKVDADIYQKMVKKPTAKIETFKNVVDLADYPTMTKFKKYDLIITGSFWEDSPMEKGVRWFLEKVWKKLYSQRTETTLLIVGKNADTVLEDVKLPNVTIKGTVPSTSKYFQASRIALVPLFFESGTRYKILEAGAHKLAVVSTSLGAEGIKVNEKQLLIADKPSEFLKKTLLLLEDDKKRKKMGKSLYKLVEKNYSLKTAQQEATAIVSSLITI